jgi:hypothetical protein
MNSQRLTPLQSRRAIRFGALAILIVAGLAFHSSGREYDAIRGVYLVVVVGLLVTGRRGMRGARGGTGGYGGWQRPGTAVGPTAPTTNPMGAPGWIPDGADPSVERYWDGLAWTKRRRWDGRGWVEDD